MTQQSAAPQADVAPVEPTADELVEAERRVPDVAQYAGGVSSDSQHAALRASVRQLGQLLGEALTRHEGPELLAQVERGPTALARAPGRRAARRARRASTTPPPSVLARAFTAYFQLVNITEQLHRWREIAAGEEGPLAATARRIGEALDEGTIDRELIDRRARPPGVPARLHRPPHRGDPPLRAGACCARSPTWCPPSEDPRRHRARLAQLERRLAELVDLLWQTDELRIVRPEPTDEARTATYYLQLARHRRSSPTCSKSSTGRSATIDVELPPTARPLRFGTLGRRRPRRQPQRHARRSPSTSSRLQHDSGLRDAHRAASRTCWTRCAPRPGSSPSPTTLLDQPRGDAEALPDHLRGRPPAQRRGALPAQAHLRPGPAAAHPRPAGRRHPARARPRLPRASTSCSPTSP